MALGFCFKGDDAISHEQEPGKKVVVKVLGEELRWCDRAGFLSFFRPRTGTEAEMLGASIE